MNSVMGDDQFYASYTYDHVMERHDWHDGSGECGKPANGLPRRVRKALSGAKPTEKQLNANMYSRICKQIMTERNRRTREAKDQATREKESAQGARLISAGGKCAYQWLQIPPKAARWGL